MKYNVIKCLGLDVFTHFSFGFEFIRKLPKQFAYFFMYILFQIIDMVALIEKRFIFKVELFVNRN